MVTADASGDRFDAADGGALDGIEALVRENRFLRDRIDALMNVTHAAILILDPETGLILDGNDVAVGRYASSREELLSMNIGAINPLPRSEIAARLRQAANTGGNHFEFRHRLRDGRMQEVDVYSGPIRFNGRRALISFIHDATRRKAIERKLRQMATFDALTGCYNRRPFLSGLRRAMRLAGDGGLPLAFAMLDLDHFKAINDDYGHQVGDGLLRAVAIACRAAVGAAGSVGRLGGEEFGVMLSESDLETACERLEALRAAVRATRVSSPLGDVGATVSVGLALQRPGEDTERTLISRADAALYAAKAAGRDRLEIAAP